VKLGRSLSRKNIYILRPFWKSLLRRIFGPKKDEALGGWRKLHNEELHNLYPSPNFFREIKSRRMRWAGYAAHMVPCQLFVRRGRNDLGDVIIE
jgi:hypothetical protein